MRGVIGIVLVLALFLLVLAQPAHAITIDYVDALGNQWGDLNDTIGFSWNEIDALCPTDGVNPCNGSLGSVPVTGWIWGTQDQVRELFREVTGLTDELDDYGHSVNDSSWAAPALSLLTPTFDEVWRSYTVGWTSTTTPQWSSIAWGAMIINNTPTNEADGALLTFLHDKADSNPVGGNGIWLFRPAAVPEPSTIFLLATGLAGVMRYARRKR